MSFTFKSLHAQIAQHNRSIKSILAVTGSNSSSAILGAIGGLLTARFIEPAIAGAFRVYTIPLMYLVILHLGTPDGLYRQLPYYVGKEQPEKVKALASTSGAWNIYISVIVSLGFIVLSLHCLYHGNLQGLIGWLSQAIVSWGVFYGVYLSTTYRTVDHFVLLSKIELTQSLLNFGMVFLLPFLKFYGLCARSSIPSILGLLLCNKYRPIKVTYNFRLVDLKEVVKVGFPFFSWIYLSSPLWIASESYLMLKFGGLTALGLFGVAVVMRDGLSVLPRSIHQVLMPKIVEKYARESSLLSINKIIIKITFITTTLMTIIVIIFNYSLEFLVPILIPKYVNGLILMQLCAWASVIQAASLPLNTLFANGNSWLYGRSVLLGFIIFIIATWLILPLTDGIYAVAISSLIGRTVRVIGAYFDIWFLMKKKTDFPNKNSSKLNA